MQPERGPACVPNSMQGMMQGYRGGGGAAYVGPQVVVGRDGEWELQGCDEELVRAF